MASTQVKDAEFRSTKEHQRIEAECSPRMVHCDAIKNEFLCAICLGILNKTVTSQECLHRFCQECIRTSLQISNQECPTCRAKLTESNLRADPVFDNLIEKLFPQTDTPSYQSDQKDSSINALESHERNHRPETKSSEAVDFLTVTNSGCPKFSQQADSKNSNITKTRENLDDVYNNGTYSATKRFRSSIEDPVNEGLIGENNISTKIRNINVEQLQETKSKIETKEDTPKALRLNVQEIKQKLRKSSTPKRRSIRIEAIQIESDKNKSEIDYNLRLSNGTAQVFFSSLQLQPNNLEAVTNFSCNHNKGPGLMEDEYFESTRSIEKRMALGQEKDNVKSKEEIEVAKIVTKEDRTIELKETGDECDTATQHATFIETGIPRVKENAEGCDTLVQKEYQFVPDENANLLDSKNLISHENMDAKGTNKRSKISKKQEDQIEMVLPRRRSQRFAAFMANENILMQTAPRRRMK